MNYRIERTEPYSLFGVAIQLTPEDTRMEHIFDKLGLYAGEVLENGSHDATNLAAGQTVGTLLTAVRFDFKPDGSCKFMFAAPKPDRDVDSTFTVIDVPQTEWAVFDYKQVLYPETHEPLYRGIYEEWFPTSEYEQAEGPCLERFPEGKTEVWIPIQRKS